MERRCQVTKLQSEKSPYCYIWNSLLYFLGHYFQISDGKCFNHRPSLGLKKVLENPSLPPQGTSIIIELEDMIVRYLLSVILFPSTVFLTKKSTWWNVILQQTLNTRLMSLIDQQPSQAANSLVSITLVLGILLVIMHSSMLWRYSSNPVILYVLLQPPSLEVKEFSGTKVLLYNSIIVCESDVYFILYKI